MGRGKPLNNEERQRITKFLKGGFNIDRIAKLLKRDRKTIRKAVENINFTRKTRSDKGKIKCLSNRDIRKLKFSLAKHPLYSSKQIFAAAGIKGISKSSRCTILKKLARVAKASREPPLSSKNKVKRMNWGRRYMKTDFSKTIFTDECRATLDGPDGWRRGWVLDTMEVPVIMRRQQGGGGVMFWAAIVDNRLVGPFKVESNVKMNSETYSAFLDEYFFKWYKKQTRAFKLNCMFMHDNAPAHASHYTAQYLASKGISDNKIMQWPAQSPDLNPIENLWSTVKRELYPGDKQYTSVNQLWKAIQKVCANIKPEEIKKLTQSMDDRLFKVVQKNGKYIKY